MAELTGRGHGDSSRRPRGRGESVRASQKRSKCSGMCVRWYMSLSTRRCVLYLACCLLEESQGSLFQLPLETGVQLEGRGSLRGLQEDTELGEMWKIVHGRQT